MTFKEKSLHVYMYVYVCVCVYVCIYIYVRTGIFNDCSLQVRFKKRVSNLGMKEENMIV